MLNAMQPLDRASVKDLLPKGSSYALTDEIMDMIGSMGEDTGVLQDYMEEMFTTNIPALKEVNIGLKSYIDAVKYITLKQRCSTNLEAWKLTFPDKVARLRKEGKVGSIDTHVSIYNKRKIVVKIEADLMVALHIQYAGMRHAAIQKQFELMNGKASPTAMPVMVKDKDEGVVPKVNSNGKIITRLVYHKVSPVVQQLASSKIIELTTIPTATDINIKIGLTDDAISEQKMMYDKFAEIAERQQRMMLEGGNIEDVQVIGDIIAGDDNESE